MLSLPEIEPSRRSSTAIRLIISGDLVLRFISGPESGRSVRLTEAQSEIGSGPQSGIRLRGPLVSQSHCRVIRTADRWILEDLSSRNGTFLNAKLIRRAPVGAGDEIILGSSVIRCDYHDPDIRGSRRTMTGDSEIIPSMIAHELKNYLHFMDDCVDVIYRETGADRSCETGLRSIQYAREQIDQLIETLRSGCSPLRLRSCDLKELIDEQIDLMSVSMSASQVTVDFGFPMEPAWVRIDRSKFAGVILNLLKNALESMTGPGRIEIGLTATPEEVMVWIKDDGKGMDPDTLSAMWSPLFTTRENGCGLGAFIARTVVLRHQGRIWAESMKGNGTTIHIGLPAAGDADAETIEDSGG